MAYSPGNNGIKDMGTRSNKQGRTLPEYWADYKRQVEERKKRGKPEMPTGIAYLDDATDGIHRGELWTVAGKSGGGKTSLALQIACNVGHAGKKNVLFISLEMRGEEIVSRMFCNQKEYDNVRLKVGEFSDDFEAKEKDFLCYLTNIDFELVEYGYNFKEIIHVIETHYTQDRRPDLIVIDFAQLIDWQEIGDERLAIQEYVRKLAELAKTKNMAIMLVSQLRRLPSGADYQRPPDMIDLKGTGALEQLSHVVVLIHRIIENCQMKCFIKIAKNRNGETGEREVNFEGSMFKFSEYKETSPRTQDRYGDN